MRVGQNYVWWHLFFVLIVCLCLSGCEKPSPSTKNEFLAKLDGSSCEFPIVINYKPSHSHAKLSEIERRDLIMTYTALIPVRDLEGTCPETDVRAYLYEDQAKLGFKQNASLHVLFNPLGVGDIVSDENLIKHASNSYLKSKKCLEAWAFLTPLIEAGSTKAAESLASAFSFPDDVNGHTYFFITQSKGYKWELSGSVDDLILALMIESLPSGRNQRYDGQFESSYFIKAYLRRNVIDQNQSTPCSLELLTYECKVWLVEEGYVMPISEFFQVFNDKRVLDNLSCARRKNNGI